MSRMISSVALLISSLAATVPAEETCRVSVAVSPEIRRVTSIAQARSTIFGFDNTAVTVKIWPHTLNPGGLQAAKRGDGYASTSLVVAPFAYSTVYTAQLNCYAEQVVEFWKGSDQASAQTPAPPPPPPQQDPCGGSGGVLNPVDQGCGPESPILIAFAGPYVLSGADDPVWFDMAGSGVPRQIGWSARESEEAFLWLDRNFNGIVDNGKELFGDATLLATGARAQNGFEALRELDENRDGVLDRRDARWAQLMLWYDRNHDGVSQQDEIVRVSDSALESMSLDYRWSGRRDRYGNMLRYESTVWIGGVVEPRPRRVYDVFFVNVQ